MIWYEMTRYNELYTRCFNHKKRKKKEKHWRHQSTCCSLVLAEAYGMTTGHTLTIGLESALRNARLGCWITQFTPFFRLHDTLVHARIKFVQDFTVVSFRFFWRSGRGPWPWKARLLGALASNLVVPGFLRILTLFLRNSRWPNIGHGCRFCSVAQEDNGRFMIKGKVELIEKELAIC